MKRLILNIGLLLIGLISFSQTYDLTVSGLVTDFNSGAPVPGQEIIVYTDSVAGGNVFFGTALTNEAGLYNITFSPIMGEQGIVTAETMSCGMIVSGSAGYSPNQYNVVIDLQICADSSGGGDCQAMFDYSINDPDPTTVNFIDYSSGYPTTWYWEFGDGITSTMQNPTHTYNAMGTYWVTLTIENDSTMCSSTIVSPVIVEDSIFPPECQAGFWYYNDSLNDLTLYFQDMSISPEGVSSWSWSFGDGTGSSDQNPIHTYANEGIYTVCLTISDSMGNCEDTYCMDAIAGYWQPDCEAMFYYYPLDSNNTGSNSIQFIDISIGNPDTWYWEFGEGQYSTEQNPVHTFSESGIYPVCLTITNTDDSCISSFCQDVLVYNDTIPTCLTWFTYSISDLTADFIAYTEGMQGDTEYFWTFGDSTTANGQNPQHVYSESGYYNVTLTSSSAGCTATYTETIWVGELELNILGNVYLLNNNDSTTADFGTVNLMTFDTIGNNLITVETTEITDFGHYEFESVAIENCIYFIQAELSQQSAYFGQYAPTYHYSSLNWENAIPVFPFPANWSYDIMLIPTTSSSTGTGAITGNLTGETTRGILADVEMLLLNVDDEPLKYIRTDSEGNFDFTTLAYGTYKLKTEMVGITSEPIEIILSEEKPTADLEIIVHNGEAVLGIEEPISDYVEHIGETFPNPVFGALHIELEMKESANTTFSVYDQYGKNIISTHQKINNGTYIKTIDVQHLENGVYFLTVSFEDGTMESRKFVKLR